MSEDIIDDATKKYIISSTRNLKLALAVEQALPSVKKHIQCEFWRALKKEIESRLSELNKKWYVEEHNRVFIDPDSKEGGLNIFPDEKSKNNIILLIRKDGQSYNLYYGISFREVLDNYNTIETINFLKSVLNEKNGMKSNKWNIAWDWCRYNIDYVNISHSETLIRIFEDHKFNETQSSRGSIAASLAQGLVDIISTHGDAIEAADRDIRNLPPSG